MRLHVLFPLLAFDVFFEIVSGLQVEILGFSHPLRKSTCPQLEPVVTSPGGTLEFSFWLHHCKPKDAS
jgi:hypothetical protein